MNRFPHGWPVEEFLKTYLKNKRAYARKKGYLTETNQKHILDEDEEEEQIEEPLPEQEQEEEVEEDQENEEDGGWLNRGNGWFRGSGAAEDAPEDAPEDDDIY